MANPKGKPQIDERAAMGAEKTLTLLVPDGIEQRRGRGRGRGGGGGGLAVGVPLETVELLFAQAVVVVEATGAA